MAKNTRFRWSNPVKQKGIKIQRTSKGSAVGGGGYGTSSQNNQGSGGKNVLPISPGGQDTMAWPSLDCCAKGWDWCCPYSGVGNTRSGQNQSNNPPRPLPVPGGDPGYGGKGAIGLGAPTPASVAQWIIENKPPVLSDVSDAEIISWVQTNWIAISPYFPINLSTNHRGMRAIVNGYRRLNNSNADQFLQSMLAIRDLQAGVRFAEQQHQQTRWEIVAWLIIGIIVGYYARKLL